MTPEFVAVCFVLSIASIVVSGAAYSFGLRWLQEQAAGRTHENLLAEFSMRQDEHDKLIRKLAEDWMLKFRQLEADWKRLKEHADSQYAGALAQAPQHRGFNRG